MYICTWLWLRLILISYPKISWPDSPNVTPYAVRVIDSFFITEKMMYCTGQYLYLEKASPVKWVNLRTRITSIKRWLPKIESCWSHLSGKLCDSKSEGNKLHDERISHSLSEQVVINSVIKESSHICHKPLQLFAKPKIRRFFISRSNPGVLLERPGGGD